MPITYNFPFCSPLSHLKVCQSCFLFPCVSATSLPFLSRMQKCPFQRANKHVFLFIRFPPSWKKKNVLNYMFAQTHKRGYKTPPLWGMMEKLNAVSGEKLFDFLQFPKNLICDSDNPRFRSYSVSLQWLLSPLTSQQYKGNCSQGLDWPKFDQTQHGSKTTSQKKKQGKKKKKPSHPCHIRFVVHFVRGADPFQGKTNSLAFWHYQQHAPKVTELPRICLWEVYPEELLRAQAVVDHTSHIHHKVIKLVPLGNSSLVQLLQLNSDALSFLYCRSRYAFDCCLLPVISTLLLKHAEGKSLLTHNTSYLRRSVCCGGLFVHPTMSSAGIPGCGITYF